MQALTSITLAGPIKPRHTHTHTKHTWSTNSLCEMHLNYPPPSFPTFFMYSKGRRRESKVFPLWLVQGLDRNIKRSAGSQQLQVGREPGWAQPAQRHLCQYQRCFNLLAGWVTDWLTHSLQAWMTPWISLLEWPPGRMDGFMNDSLIEQMSWATGRPTGRQRLNSWCMTDLTLCVS